MGSLPLEVRRATEADVARVTTLLVAQLRAHRIATPEARLAAAVTNLLGHPERGALLVALRDGTVVGIAALSFVWPLEHGGRSAWLEELYVVPAERSHGIGTALLRAARRTAEENGAVAIDLEVDAEHERAARLYEREGFRALPRRRLVLRLGAAD